MTTIITDLIFKLVDYIRDDNKIIQEKKLRVSKILDELASVILDTSVKLKTDEYPHNNCAILEQLSNRLHFELIDIVDQIDLDNIHGLLLEASNVEKLYAYRANGDIIRDLMRISGEIKAMSILLSI